MSRMFHPSPPGVVLREWIPGSMTVTDVAEQLQVSRVMLSKILNGKSGVSADMAIRLSTWLKTSPDLWVGMQSQWDLWQAEQKPRPNIQPLEQIAA